MKHVTELFGLDSIIDFELRPTQVRKLKEFQLAIKHEEAFPEKLTHNEFVIRHKFERTDSLIVFW